MVFIVGGYAQGKMEYAKSNYPGRNYFELNKNAYDWYMDGKDMLSEVKNILQKDNESVLISQEIGKGIVPLDKTERDFRDKLGRLQVETAKLAKEVIWVSCGIGRRIK